MKEAKLIFSFGALFCNNNQYLSGVMLDQIIQYRKLSWESNKFICGFYAQTLVDDYNVGFAKLSYMPRKALCDYYKVNNLIVVYGNKGMPIGDIVATKSYDGMTVIKLGISKYYQETDHSEELSVYEEFAIQSISSNFNEYLPILLAGDIKSFNEKCDLDDC